MIIGMIQIQDPLGQGFLDPKTFILKEIFNVFLCISMFQPKNHLGQSHFEPWSSFEQTW